jgi:hypothetical protein
MVPQGTLGSYLRDALHEGGAAAVACLPAPRTWGFCASFVFFYFFLLVDSTGFLVIKNM